ncbi:hypothetical protein B0J12DRAFT_764991 [Macrophomina phaseolina]|uniref:Uncharacterized protein n=1 Tax=Macrophomina phaseolina TaxID=35725 RepID=A0ABQ8FZG0_9PEZI|nr:hypothetical protein B0J12DRAFT_764991 [Macrophomina phaseolina]
MGARARGARHAASGQVIFTALRSQAGPRQRSPPAPAPAPRPVRSRATTWQQPPPHRSSWRAVLANTRGAQQQQQQQQQQQRPRAHPRAAVAQSSTPCEQQAAPRPAELEPGNSLNDPSRISPISAARPHRFSRAQLRHQPARCPPARQPSRPRALVPARRWLDDQGGRRQRRQGRRPRIQPVVASAWPRERLGVAEACGRPRRIPWVWRLLRQSVRAGDRYSHSRANVPAASCPPAQRRQLQKTRRKPATVAPSADAGSSPPGDSMTERHCACFKRAEAR